MKTTLHRRSNLIALLAAFTLGSLAGGIQADDAANWPNWRGPNRDATAEGGDIPLEWSTTRHIAWRTELPHWAGSSPIVWGDHIFLTSPEKGGKGGAGDAGGKRIYLYAFERERGGFLWRRELSYGNKLMRKHNNASSSPVTDGQYVWAVTGTGEVVALDFTGKEIWRRNLQDDYGKFGINWGYANSPLLHAGRLVIPVLHGFKTDDPSYLVSLDAKTGKEIWRTERPTDAIKESPDSYATPQLLEVDGRKRVIINGGDIVTAHDFETGAEVWRAKGLNPKNLPFGRIVGSCLILDDLIIAPGRVDPMLAIRPGGEGDVSATHIAWSARGADVPSPVSDGKYIWVLGDRGVISCLDAKTGQQLYEPQRIANGTYSASPILAGGKIYAINENAETTILEAGPEFEILAKNKLDGSYTLSTPAVSGDNLFIRTGEFLYRIGKKAG